MRSNQAAVSVLLEGIQRSGDLVRIVVLNHHCTDQPAITCGIDTRLVKSEKAIRRDYVNWQSLVSGSGIGGREGYIFFPSMSTKYKRCLWASYTVVSIVKTVPDSWPYPNAPFTERTASLEERLLYHDGSHHVVRFQINEQSRSNRKVAFISRANNVKSDPYIKCIGHFLPLSTRTVPLALRS